MVSFRIVEAKNSNISPINEKQLQVISSERGTQIKKENLESLSDNSILQKPSYNEMKEIIKKKNSYDGSITDEEMYLNKRIEEKEKRVFWTKEKIEYFREKCKTVKEKILHKQNYDFNELRKAINDNNIEKVKKIMLDSEFIDFYKLELKKSDMLEYILFKGHMELLLKLLQNSFYSYFDYSYIFTFIKRIIKEKLNDNEQKNVINNIIKYKLYDFKMNRIIIWLVGIIKFYEAFRLMVENHDDLKQERTNCNFFKTDNDINIYVNKNKNFYSALNCSLQFKMEDLAIAIVTFKQEVQSFETLEIAINNKCMRFLQHIWEVSNNDFKFDYKQGTLGHSIQNSIFSDFLKRKSIMIKSKEYNKYFNRGEPPIMISKLVEMLDSLKYTSEIMEITSWKYLDADKELIEKLFLLNKFEEINILLWKKEYNWDLKKEHFKKVIEANECDLILYFLKISHCRVELNDHKIQKMIVSNYISKGNTMYYAAEMVGYIYKTRWDNNLTK